jgi:hypothetical protein
MRRSTSAWTSRTASGAEDELAADPSRNLSSPPQKKNSLTNLSRLWTSSRRSGSETKARKGSESSHGEDALSPRCTPGSPGSAMYKRSHEAIFSATAAIQVPESVQCMREDELDAFKLLLDPGMWYSFDSAMFKLGAGLSVFPPDMSRRAYRGIFMDADNELRVKLKALLLQLGQQDWCEMDESACIFRRRGQNGGKCDSVGRSSHSENES